MDTEYIIDCSFQFAETTPIELAVLNGNRKAYCEVRRLVDQNLEVPNHFLQNTARFELGQMSLNEQYYFALKALGDVEYGIQFLLERAHHIVQKKCQDDLRGNEAAGRNALLTFDAYSASLPERLITTEADIGEGVVRTILDRAVGPLMDRWSQDLDLMVGAINWYRQDNGETFKTMFYQDLIGNDKQSGQGPGNFMHIKHIVEAQRQREKKREREQHALKTKAKSAIKKATKLFQSLGQEKNLSLFVSGHAVELSNPESDLKFLVKPLKVKDWLIDRTAHGRSHTPYELELTTKDDVYLCKLCVYFDDTPVLDSLLALSLFVSSGDEVKILEKANWFALDKDWKDSAVLDAVVSRHPHLAKKLPQIKSEISEHRKVQPGGIYELHSAWEPYKGRVDQWLMTWLDPIKASVMEIHRCEDTKARVAGEISAGKRMLADKLKGIAHSDVAFEPLPEMI